VIRLSEDLRGLLSQLPDMDAEELIEAAHRPLPESIRLNTLKANENNLRRLLESRGWRLHPLPWARHCYLVDHAPSTDLGATLEHMLGLIYIQGPVSMLPVEVLDPQPGDLVLDLCAAPGGKSTQIAQLLQMRGVLVANDVSRKRLKALAYNIQRWQAANSIVTLADGRLYHRWASEAFDRVLVDAPCSSLGIASKDWSVLSKYRGGLTRRLVRLQLALLESGYRCLRLGGALVYATCTIHPLENEGVVSAFLERHPEARLMDVRPTGLRARRALEVFGGESFSTELSRCFKCYPYDNMGEGFFVAKIVRGEA
jgi:NOL1/NOP2/sun family putative RNA methylase